MYFLHGKLNICKMGRVKTRKEGLKAWLAEEVPMASSFVVVAAVGAVDRQRLCGYL